MVKKNKLHRKDMHDNELILSYESIGLVKLNSDMWV